MEMRRFEKAIVNGPAVSWYHVRWSLPRVLDLSLPGISGPLLEVGCGDGRTTEGILQLAPKALVTAIDYDAEQVKLARHRVEPLATVQQGDVLALPFRDGAFQTVVSMNMLHHVAPVEHAVAEISRVLASKGEFLFMDYTARFFRGPVGKLFPPESRFTAEEFNAMLYNNGLRVEKLTGKRVIRGRATKYATILDERKAIEGP